MKAFWLGVAATILWPIVATAQNAAIPFTKFVDPTENSFAVEVPQGWVAKGGVKRLSPLIARNWVTVVSPDGMVQVFYGDPDVPNFSLPKNGQQEGETVPSRNPNLPPTVALTYRPGAEFAKFYGPRSLAAVGCTGAQVTGTWSMPDLSRAQQARAAELVRGVRVPGGFTPPPDDAGLVTFTCQNGGRQLAAAVVADTGQPNSAGGWGAGVIAGYLAVPAQAPLAQAVLSRLLASRQWNPQWDQAMRDKLQEIIDNQVREGDAVMAEMQERSAMFGEMIRERGEADRARMRRSHNAYMEEQDRRSEINNENFRYYQAQRSLNSWRFDAHIRNGELYRDLDSGRIFEVDH